MRGRADHFSGLSCQNDPMHMRRVAFSARILINFKNRKLK